MTEWNRDNRFWRERARRYNRLEWVRKDEYLSAFLEPVRSAPSGEVLDIGTGTGIVAHALAANVEKVVGIDTSQDMLDRALQQRVASNVVFLRGDVHNLPFSDGTFSKVTARMVFHHIVSQTEEAICECYRVLKNGGVMCLSEGVPPSPKVKDWYTEMFKLKEERLTFMEDDLVELMRYAGFRNTKTVIHVSKRCSIRNWLVNSGLPLETQSAIYQMHLALDDYGKKAYNMVTFDHDILIDMKFAIVVGEKRV
jgi:ubiquinone/menaquinone biosynthesis C-methylase UbiE